MKWAHSRGKNTFSQLGITSENLAAKRDQSRPPMPYSYSPSRLAPSSSSSLVFAKSKLDYGNLTNADDLSRSNESLLRGNDIIRGST